MANNKMLIDASHPEETRVVVVRGNRIEEFDFEAEERKQLRGNIYLAKVTRVEPSLQAAFIDYGGNRHGFLAFAEIHPDYYQIPAADRQALLAEEEAAAAEAARAEEEPVEIDAGDLDSEDDSDDEAPSRQRRKRGGRSRRGSRRGRKDEAAAAGEADTQEEDAAGESEDTDSDSAVASEAEAPNKRSRGRKKTRAAGDDASAETDGDEAESATGKPAKTRRKAAAKASSEEAGADEDGDEKPKRKRATRSRKKAASEDGESEAAGEPQDDDKASGRTMAAMMEIDQVSEPAPEPEDEPENAAAEDRGEETTSETAEAAEAEGEDEAGRKPAAKKRRAPRRKSASKAQDGDDSDEGDGEDADAEGDVTTSGAGETGEAEATSDDDDDDAADDKPARRARRGRKGRKEKEARSRDDDDGGNGDGSERPAAPVPVESVGQEDALEEARIRRPRRQYKIQEVIRRRQVMLVQVVKEERGNKGAALTTYLSLAGRYSVLMPNTARGGGISRKITNQSDRKRLKEIAQSLDVPRGMGVILRTAGASQDRDEIQRDFDYLMRLWDNVRNLTLASTAPFLVYEEGSLIKRSIRDLYNKEISEVIVSGEEGYREARDFMKMLMPEHVKNVKLYQDDQPIFSRFSVETQLEKMMTQQVTLKSGGYLIINQTEALVAIDVNSGKSTREHSIEATALQTNLEAAEEVARQLRLRDLAGLIVIDFIDMEEKRNNRSVERKLKECLKHDRARIQVGHISHFGLLEMSRQRIRASVLESTMAVCPHCNGVGHVRSKSSLALAILRSLEDYLNRNNRNDVTVRVAPAMALYILNQKRRALAAMESRFNLEITVDSDHEIEGQDFEIEKGAPASGDPGAARAIGMMDDEPAAEAPETAGEPSYGDDDARGEDTRADGERSGRRGRRRRGHGRGRERDENGARYSAEEDSADNGGGNDEDGESAAEEADSGSKETRRDRDTVHEGKQKSATRRDAPPKGEPDDAEAEPARPARPGRRTGRPGKKPASQSENGAAPAETGDKPVAAASAARDAAPPRAVQRRNTRRVAAGEKADDTPAGSEPDAETGEAPGAGWSGFLG